MKVGKKERKNWKIFALWLKVILLRYRTVRTEQLIFQTDIPIVSYDVNHEPRIGH